MKISFNWLKTFIELTETPEEIGKILTATGLEVEDIEKVEAVPGGLKGFVVAEVLTCDRFMMKEKQLSLCTVDTGAGQSSTIVCGAANVAAGQKVIVATVGTTLYGQDGKPIFTIERKKTYGHFSEGMICAEDEMGVGTSHDGIMVLTTDLPNGTPAAAYFDLSDDFVIHIGLTPNRADAASHFGVARDLKAVLKRPVQLPQVDAPLKQTTGENPISVTIQNPEACPRFCGVYIEGVTVRQSPDWLKEKLTAVGIKPRNAVVDVTNYVLHGMGQPMHAFDADTITGNEIVVRVPEKKTPLLLLAEETERQATGYDLMICNAEKPMALAGIKGGKHSGVEDTTTNVFLEVAYFDPAWIRKSDNFHALKTDASFRYARGTDPNMPPFAARLAAQLICQLTGGEIKGDFIDIYPDPIAHVQIDVRYANVDRLIGKVIDRSTIAEILNNLDIECLHQTPQGFVAVVPPYRVDVRREADVIEEILRIYGLDNIEISNFLATELVSGFPKIDPDKQRLRVAQLLAANGFNETLSNSLTKASYAAAIKASLPAENVLMLNALSEDLSVMRQTMVFSGLESLARNVNRRQRDLKIFEFGKTYHRTADSYEEQQHLAVFLTGNAEAETWLTKSREVSFYDLASTVQRIMAAMRVQDPKTSEHDETLFEYGHTYQLGKKTLVKFGLLKRSITKMLDIKQSVFYADFDWELLLKQYSDAVRFKDIGKFPEVRRDLSLVIEKTVTYEQIKKVAQQYERKLLQAVNVFDVYEGDNLAGKKAYSVSFILQDFEQTLTENTIDKTMERLIKGFEKDLGAIIRK